RRTAQRLLVDRKAERGVPALVTLAADASSSLGRVHALWTLDALGGLDESMILRALNDSEPGVRENALRLAEPRLGRSTTLSDGGVHRAGREPDARVQFQVLATLGFID